MSKYSFNKLNMYIEQSKLIIINEKFKIRLSQELYEKYKQGLYTQEIQRILSNIEEINNLRIKYPANARPVFYLYIVPNEKFTEFLSFPKQRQVVGGGKPVPSFDLDGFNLAYGLSSNMLENGKYSSIMSEVNSIHELSHLVHSMFFMKNRFLDEGFAEALPLYTMDYESRFNEHKELLGTLKKEQIFSAQQLIELEEKNQFNMKPLIVNTSVSFELPYISSYLFVRGCLEIIEEKFHFDRIESTQKFLEIVRQSQCINQYLVFDIAQSLGISGEALLNGIEMQQSVINNIINNQ